jgi:hypothetical protein
MSAVGSANTARRVRGRGRWQEGRHLRKEISRGTTFPTAATAAILKS